MKPSARAVRRGRSYQAQLERPLNQECGISELDFTPNLVPEALNSFASLRHVLPRPPASELDTGFWCFDQCGEGRIALGLAMVEAKLTLVVRF
jgi:hypothetical protein